MKFKKLINLLDNQPLKESPINRGIERLLNQLDRIGQGHPMSDPEFDEDSGTWTLPVRTPSPKVVRIIKNNGFQITAPAEDDMYGGYVFVVKPITESVDTLNEYFGKQSGRFVVKWKHPEGETMFEPSYYWSDKKEAEKFADSLRKKGMKNVTVASGTKKEEPKKKNQKLQEQILKEDELDRPPEYYKNQLYVKQTGANRYAGGSHRWLRIRRIEKLRDPQEFAIFVNLDGMEKAVTVTRYSSPENLKFRIRSMPATLDSVLMHYFGLSRDPVNWPNEF